MIKYINKLVKKLQKAEKGQGMVEYALIIAFVAAIAIFAFNNGLGDAVKNAFTNASSMVNSAGASAKSLANTNGGWSSLLIEDEQITT